jgi:copper chaperone
MMITLNVKGMTCGHCESAVRKALAEVAGVRNVVEVDREKEVAVVDGGADPAALVAAVREEGYEAEVAG